MLKANISTVSLGSYTPQTKRAKLVFAYHPGGQHPKDIVKISSKGVSVAFQGLKFIAIVDIVCAALFCIRFHTEPQPKIICRVIFSAFLSIAAN
jgi:hypothetical protein